MLTYDNKISKNQKIYIPQILEGNLIYSENYITNIINDKLIYTNNLTKKPESSGSPIFLYDSIQVIGII